MALVHSLCIPEHRLQLHSYSQASAREASTPAATWTDQQPGESEELSPRNKQRLHFTTSWLWRTGQT